MRDYITYPKVIVLCISRDFWAQARESRSSKAIHYKSFDIELSLNRGGSYPYYTRLITNLLNETAPYDLNGVYVL